MRGELHHQPRVAREYPRGGVSLREVQDAEPALVSLAWRTRGLRPAVEALILVAREITGSAGLAGAPAGEAPTSDPPADAPSSTGRSVAAAEDTPSPAPVSP